jgi:hypothetical protein
VDRWKPHIAVYRGTSLWCDPAKKLPQLSLAHLCPQNHRGNPCCYVGISSLGNLGAVYAIGLASLLAGFTYTALAFPTERCPEEKEAMSLFLKPRTQVSWGFLNFSSNAWTTESFPSFFLEPLCSPKGTNYNFCFAGGWAHKCPSPGIHSLTWIFWVYMAYFGNRLCVWLQNNVTEL